MAESKERSWPKSRIESLSDIIFGLALSIGALTLIGMPPKDFTSLLYSISSYTFSFLILISIWYSYTRTMAHLRIETQIDVNLNILLLFLVSIEPFLFNQLLVSSIPTQDISIVYALDLGTLFAIQALMANSILSSGDLPSHLQRHYSLQRNAEVTGALFFFVSTLPVFWTLQISVGSHHVPVRFIFWVVPLFLRNIRGLFEKYRVVKSVASINLAKQTAEPTGIELTTN